MSTNLKDQVSEVLSSLASRVSYSTGKSFLQSIALPTSLGWERTIRSATKAVVGKSNAEEILGRLVDAFSTHTQVGEKLIRYYGYAGIPPGLKIANKAALKAAANSLNIPSNLFVQRYPLPVIDKADLAKLEGKLPTLTAVHKSTTAITFQFCSVRSFREQVPLDIADFDSDAQAILEGYTEVIGIRPIRRQCFDTVIYHFDREIVELRVDAPEGISVHQQRAAVANLMNAFTSLNLLGGWSPFGGAPINFHKLIGRLYRKRSEGTVFQLGFTATAQTSSSNNGARLLRKKNQDLRKDVFHKAGASAVQDISPYTIGVEWHPLGFTMSPKLIVPGTVKMLYTSPVLFPEVIVRDCFTNQEFAFVDGKINTYC